MRTEDLDFFLPPELIAQTPAEAREASRLLHYKRAGGTVAHRRFSDLPGLFRAGDLMVFNDAKVIPARFMLRKNTGGRIEGLFLSEPTRGKWRVLLKNLGTYRGELAFEGEASLSCRVMEVLEAGEVELKVNSDDPALLVLSRLGRMPLPPYIRREKGHDPRDSADRERYQTVYAKNEGSVAAPTAGLHFTPELLGELDARGIERTFVTLHVGLGTFRPVSVDYLHDHVMHVESYEISGKAADALNRAKAEGRRIVAVGTTAARVIESQKEAVFTAHRGETGIFIYPPYRWSHVGALITNFHLPKSTLIALVAAMVGMDEQKRIYREAIEERYRFFSYGDGMLIE